MREPVQPAVPEKVLSRLELWVSALLMGTTNLRRPALPPAGKNFSSNGTMFPSMNHDGLNEAFEGSIATTWNAWRFYKIVNILFLTQRSCFRLQACFYPVLSAFDLEHTRSKTSFRRP
jgi:hypothetical protein